jgi:hypothetical protein
LPLLPASPELRSGTRPNKSIDNPRGKHILDAVEVYKSEAREVIRRFLTRRLSFPDCIAALDSALADLLPRVPPEELETLRAVVLANNQIVMREMERRIASSPGRCFGAREKLPVSTHEN